MGIEPGALGGSWDIQTQPRPQQPAQKLSLHNLSIRNGLVDVEEDGASTVRLANHTASVLRWNAVFPGDFHKFLAAGKSVKTHQDHLPDGRVFSWATLKLPPGSLMEVTTTPPAK